MKYSASGLAFALAPVLVVALAAPVAGQMGRVTGPESPEELKKRALWTGCTGVSLAVNVDHNGISKESVWNAAEVPLRSARVYYENPEDPTEFSRWTVRVVVWGVATATYVAVEFLDDVAGSLVTRRIIDQSTADEVESGDLDFLFGTYTVQTYRVESLGGGQIGAADHPLLASHVLESVRKLIDLFLVDYLRAHADCGQSGGEGLSRWF